MGNSSLISKPQATGKFFKFNKLEIYQGTLSLKILGRG